MNERPTNQLPDDEDLMRLQHEFFSKKIAPAANLVPKSGQTNAGTFQISMFLDTFRYNK